MQTDVFLIIVLFVIVVILAFYLYKLYSLINKLTKGVDGEDLKKVLVKILASQEKNQVDIKGIQNKIDLILSESNYYIQKVGFVKFNPFSELGGEHSFSLAVLNNRESGIIITSLHTRERTRVYIKELVDGKSSSELSKEELKAIKIANKK